LKKGIKTLYFFKKRRKKWAKNTISFREKERNVLGYFPMRKTKAHRVLGIVMVSLSVLTSLWVGFLCYALDYYKVSPTGKSYLASNETISVSDEGRDYAFLPRQATSKGAVFYPGGKVESAAYAPLCAKLAEKGFAVYLPRLPYHFAFFDVNAADRFISGHSEISSWYVLGHSLGGAMLGEYASNHFSELKGIAFLGAYSVNNLSQTSLKCACLYGSEDGVMNREKYQANYANLPSSTREKVIAGGNHAGFGEYGSQSGDGKASISGEEQAQITVDFLSSMWN
jgi:hypothetical protein